MTFLTVSACAVEITGAMKLSAAKLEITRASLRIGSSNFDADPMREWQEMFLSHADNRKNNNSLNTCSAAPLYRPLPITFQQALQRDAQREASARHARTHARIHARTI
jgi:hypothetical protein